MTFQYIDDHWVVITCSPMSADTKLENLCFSKHGNCFECIFRFNETSFIFYSHIFLELTGGTFLFLKEDENEICEND